MFHKHGHQLVNVIKHAQPSLVDDFYAFSGERVPLRFVSGQPFSSIFKASRLCHRGTVNTRANRLTISFCHKRFANESFNSCGTPPGPAPSINSLVGKVVVIPITKGMINPKLWKCLPCVSHHTVKTAHNTVDFFKREWPAFFCGVQSSP